MKKSKMSKFSISRMVCLFAWTRLLINLVWSYGRCATIDEHKQTTESVSKLSLNFDESVIHLRRLQSVQFRD